MNLLLINKNVRDYYEFVLSSNDKTNFVLYNPKEDTYKSILNNISQLDQPNQYTNIALISHGHRPKNNWEF